MVLGLCGCDRQVPTAPERPVSARDSARIAALAPFAVALQDVQTRILPALGTGSALDELRSALMELEPALSQPDAYEGALARANAAALQLQPDSTLFPDFDVVRLVLEQIQAVVQAPADRAQAAPQAASRREQ